MAFSEPDGVSFSLADSVEVDGVSVLEPDSLLAVAEGDLVLATPGELEQSSSLRLFRATDGT